MKPITLRNLPPDVAREIRRTAQDNNVSANKAVIRLLGQRSRSPRKKASARHHDLDGLGGAWSRNEADAFDRTLAGQRAIDEDLWK